MVVVDPDKIAILDIIGDNFGKPPSRLFVGIPSVFRKEDLAWMIMQKWPEYGILSLLAEYLITRLIL